MFHGDLRPFQKEAVDMLLERESALLAVVMGGGKTVITIAVLEELFESGKVNQGMVIVPATLKYQWAKQIEKFAPGATYVVVDGTPKQREKKYRQAARSEYTIVNYEQVVNDWQTIKHLDLDFVVADEVQAIKNFRSKRTKYVKRLTPRYRFGLTGQPVENKPEEVFSIMEWVDAEVLGSFHVFDRAFVVRNRWGGVVRYRNTDALHERLKEAMFRRSYDDIKDELPSVTDGVITVTMGRKGRRLYRTIADELMQEIEASTNIIRSFDLMAHYSADSDESPAEKAAKGRIMSRMVCLRMLCDHPELLLESAHKFNDEQHDDGSQYAAELLQRGLLEDLPKPVKMKEAVNLIKDILDGDPTSKVVLFSFFKSTLGKLEKALAEYRPVQFHGGMNAKQKESSRASFVEDSGTRIFLSSDAGGVGVDLPVANYLVNYDLPWSSGQLEQRNARIRRLSSTHRHITVLDLLVEGSLEIRQREMLEKKKAIADAIIDGKGSGRVEMDLGTLRDFLRNASLTSV